MTNKVHFAGLGSGFKLNNCPNMAKSNAIAGIPISKMMPIQPKPPYKQGLRCRDPFRKEKAGIAFLHLLQLGLPLQQTV